MSTPTVTRGRGRGATATATHGPSEPRQADDEQVVEEAALRGTAPPEAAPREAATQRAVEELLDEALARARRSAARLGPENDLLWAEIARSVEGGKRFRSALVLGTHDALGGTTPTAAVTVAAGFELLHSAFLIHDDLIDHDTVRRGRPNLAAMMHRTCLDAGTDAQQAQRWSEAAALLAGDLVLGLAHRMFASAGLAPHAHEQLTELVDETLLISAGGELVDTAFGLGLRPSSLDEALMVSESKTAMYSFRAPLRAGAIIAGAPDDLVAHLDELGILLGRSFQLVDDLLGVFAPEERIGKSNLSDLREGKQTPLMLHARHLPVWEELRDHVGRADLDQEAAAVLRTALARSEAPAAVASWARADLATVRAGLADVPEALAVVLRDVADQVDAALEAVCADIEGARCPDA